MSDITLVNTVFPSEVKVPPQGLLYLTSALEGAGFDVEIRDYQQGTLPGPWEPETLASFTEDSADVLGFSAMSYALPLIISTARLIKQRHPDKRIVLGGIGPSGAGEQLLEYCPEIDVIVLGEGERTVVDLLAAMRRGNDIGSVSGIIYRQGEKVRRTAPRPRIPSLTELAPPAYGRVDFSKYRLVDSQFGRGCPFPCAFCDIAPYWDRFNTKRPIEHYVAELETLVKSHGARDVFIVDDTFVLSRPTILQFCDEIRRRNIEFSWGCYARVDLMDEALMERMAAAGCQKIFYGLESGADHVLEEIDKNITSDLIIERVRQSLEHFPFITASFVWGFPGESLEDLQSTAYLLIYLASLGASPQLNLVLPYSYSTLYKQYRDQITFRPEYSSQLQFYEGDRGWICDMIATSPQIFSAFYQIPTPDLEEKWQFLNDAGLSPHDLQRAYDHPVPLAMEIC